MKLAKDEKVVKEWTYAKGGTKTKIADSVLTVTNKRIIHSIKNNSGLTVGETRNEIRVEDVKSVYCKSSSYDKQEAIRKMLLGGLYIVIGIVMAIIMPKILKGAEGSIWYSLSEFYYIVSLLVGVICIGIGVKRFFAPCDFKLIIMTSIKVGESLKFGEIGFRGAPAFKKGFNMSIDSMVAQDILDTLGAVILDANSQN